MAALGFWDAFNQGLEVGNKIHAASAQRNMDQELAGVDGGLQPAEQANARAQVYRKFGRDKEADQVALTATQLQGMQLQNKKIQDDMDAASAFKADQEHLFDVQNKARETDAAARALLAKGDKIGAAKLIADFRTNVIGDARGMSISGDGSVVGFENGEPVGVRSVNDPAVLNSMVNGIRGSVEDYAGSVLQKHFKSPAELAGYMQQMWQRGMEGRRFGLQERELGTRERALDHTIKNDTRRLDLTEQAHKDDVLLKERELGDNRAYRSGALSLQRAELNAKIPLISAQAGSLQASAAGQRLANIGLQGEGGIGTRSGTGQPRGGAVQVRPQDMIKFNEDANNAVMSHPNYKQMTPSDIEYAKQEYLARTYPQYFSPRQQADYSSAAASAFGN